MPHPVDISLFYCEIYQNAYRILQFPVQNPVGPPVKEAKGLRRLCDGVPRGLARGDGRRRGERALHRTDPDGVHETSVRPVGSGVQGVEGEEGRVGQNIHRKVSYSSTACSYREGLRESRICDQMWNRRNIVQCGASARIDGLG